MSRRGQAILVGLIAAIITTMIGLSFAPDAYAQSVQELRKRREQLARDIERKRKEAEQKKKQAQQLTSQINKLDQDISLTESRIEATQAQIKDKEEVIGVLNANIAQKQAELQKAEDEQRELIRVIYENGDDNLVYDIFSESITDRSDKLAYLQDLENRIEQTIQEISDLKAQLQNEKKAQEDQKAQLEDLRSKQEAYHRGLGISKKRKNDLLTNTQKTLAELEKLIEEAKREYQNVNSELYRLTQLAKKGRVSGEKRVGNLSWYWPFDGLVTTEFCERTRIQDCHTGTDVDGAIGDDVKATANGRVTFVGGERSYGYGLYVIVDHGSGVTSLYGHCDALTISVGDEVQGGKTSLCFMGNTGYAYAFLPGGDGSHLHFEIREDGVPVNPRIYLP